jgi:uncharacterized damage-inducible protein DinB
MQGELEALVLSLSDEEFTRAEAGSDDWSVERLVEHIAEVERGYRAEILRATGLAGSEGQAL